MFFKKIKKNKSNGSRVMLKVNVTVFIIIYKYFRSVSGLARILDLNSPIFPP